MEQKKSKHIGRYIRPFSLAILPYVGYYGYIYTIAILGQITTLQVRPRLARLDRLRNRARHPGEVCQSGICEQIIKSCQNQGQISQKPYFDFSRGKSIYRPLSKNLHYIFGKTKSGSRPTKSTTAFQPIIHKG